MIGLVASGALYAAALSAAVADGGADTSVEVAQNLPVPPATSTGQVPLSQPIAPVPTGFSEWAVSGSVLFGVADPFYGKVATLLSVRRGFGPIALELFGGKAFSWSGAALSICTAPGACVSPSGTRLGATPGNLGFMGGASGVWRAAEGKASLAGMANRRFGLELALGGAAVAYTVVENTTKTNVAPAGRIGLALTADLLPALGLRVEFQDLIYPAVIRGEQSIQNQALIGASIAWQTGGR